MFLDYRTHTEDLKTGSEQMLKAASSTAVIQLESFFKDKIARVDAFVVSTGSETMLQGPLLPFSGKNISPALSGKLEIYGELSGFDSLSIVDVSGRLRFKSPASAFSDPLENIKTPPVEETFKVLLEKAEKSSDVWYIVMEGGMTCILRVIRDLKGHVAGGVVAGIKPFRILSILETNTRMFPDFSFALLEKNNKVIFSEPLTGGHIQKRIQQNSHIEVVPLVMDSVRLPGWQVFTAAPEHGLFPRSMNYGQRMGLFIAGLFALILAISFIMTRILGQAINSYVSWINKACNGEIVHFERPDGRHDLYVLSHALADLSERINAVQDFCSAAAEGDFRADFPQKGETDRLGVALNGIRSYFLTVHEKIKRITLGDYHCDELENEGIDELGPMLSELKFALSRINEENFRQITGTYVQMELVRQVSGEHKLEPMIQSVLSFICRYSEAHVGVFYVRDQEENLFTLKGTYGCVRKGLPEKIAPGDGLCGQAVSEKKPLSLKGQSNGLRIASGLCDKSPSAITAFPFLFGHEVIAVLEIGALNDFKRDVIDFLGTNNESISIGIHSALSRNLTEKLLEKTMQQAESLKAQQDKLREVNEELAAQAKALKQSESRLMAREEQLNKANEALRIHSMNLEETKAILENKAEELAKSNRYKTEFLANMSHELRTPLNSIILLSNLLSEKMDENAQAKYKTFASVINNSGKDLLNLIDEVLDLTRISSGDMAVNLSQYRLPDALKVMKRVFDKTAQEKNIEFLVYLENDVPEYITTDALRLERILKNLLTNAFTYTSNGHVTLRVKRPERLSDELLMNCPPGSVIEFSVEDTGEGIPNNMHQVVFEAFKQVDGSITRKHGGAGLGLSLAREFARLLQGDILLTSALGKGSTFSLYLPDTWQEGNA